jgi:hypothetical protein
VAVGTDQRGKGATGKGKCDKKNEQHLFRSRSSNRRNDLISGVCVPVRATGKQIGHDNPPGADNQNTA